MKLFLAATSLKPEYGGPAFSVSRLAIALTHAGIEVGLWASDQSVVTTPLLPAESSIRRLGGTERQALKSFGRVDVLHDNGIWLRHNHRLADLAVKCGIPRVVSTHGMLEPWALNHKRLKKNLSWWMYRRRDLKRARCHHVTGETEATHVKRLELGVPISIIPLGVDVPSDFLEIARSERKKALFLSRIHPKKGLMMLIEAWARVRPEGWMLQIAGPDKSGHRAQLEKTVIAANLSNVVSFVGPVSGEKKKLAFFNADLFVLPTHSENFGMVVAEALAHGLPVLTTTGAPWSILRDRSFGWWVDPTVESIAEGLRQATSFKSQTLIAMGARGREWVRAELGWERVAKELIRTYQAILASDKSNSLD